MEFIDFPLDRRRLLYINVLVGQWERVGSVVVMVTNVYSKPVAEVFGSSAFFIKGFRVVKNHKEIAAALDLSAGQRPDPDGHF